MKPHNYFIVRLETFGLRLRILDTSVSVWARSLVGVMRRILICGLILSSIGVHVSRAQTTTLPPVVVDAPLPTPPALLPANKPEPPQAAAKPAPASTVSVAPKKSSAAPTAAINNEPASAAAGGGGAQQAQANATSNITLAGKAGTASEGFVPQERLNSRPIYRTGELLEVTPGLVVTQHSGEGKANQYFLRGFNLDHGTDLAITVDGMPVNMRTHGHGQGYADTNFLIPEIAESLVFRKGPYFAEEGDFASAGAIHLDINDKLPANFAQVEVGSFGHRRAVAAMSVPSGVSGTVLAAAEIVRFNGPWERSDDFKKLNGVLRYSNGTRDNGFAVTGMAYSGRWYATDQVPQRAIDSGLISRLGTLDPTDGGNAQRFSLSARWSRKDADSQTRVNAYAIRSDLNLFNNFTYFQRDPVNGDQFQQADHRTIAGGAASHTFFGTGWNGLKTETIIGAQTRADDIKVGLFNTAQRQVLSTVRDDRVSENSIGIFGQNTYRWTDWFRTIAGLRADLYGTNVKSDNPLNSGAASQGLVSPKFGIALGPWKGTEFYASAGSGFHSNDARGTVIRVDPVDGVTPVTRVPFLVRSKGAEIGVRSETTKGFSSTLSAFVLDFDSEIVFVGDAGTTEASRPSRRVGLEYTLLYRVLPWLTLDIDAAYARARFTADDLGLSGRHIPGATEGVVSAGFSIDNGPSGWFGGMKLKYFGPRPLIEDNSVRSKATTPISARIGYKFDDGLTVRLDGFNILNQRASQIDYFYASRLPGEAADVSDKHLHPLEPRSVRLVLNKKF